MLDPQIQSLLTITVRVVIIIASVFYLILALLVLRQVFEMREQVSTQTSKAITLFNLINIIQVGLVVLVTITVLFI